MKKFRVTSPEGKSLVLTADDDMPPSEQELESIFSSRSGKQTQQQAPQQMKSVSGNPFGTTGQIIEQTNPLFQLPKVNGVLQAAGDAYNSVRTPLAGTIQKYGPIPQAMTALNADFKSYGVPDLLKTILSPSSPQIQQLQDYNSADMAKDLSGGLADEILLGGAGAVAGRGVSQYKRLNEVEGALDRLLSMRASAKGRKAVSKLLPSAPIAQDVKMNVPSQIQVEGLNLIKKTKNPQDIVNRFRGEKNRVIDMVDSLVKEKNQPVSPEKIRERAYEILGNQLKNSNPDEVRAINEAVSEELRIIPTDAVSANARKRFLYQKTQNLQKAQGKGMTIVTRPEQSLVDDAFAQAYKESIEEVVPEVAEHNSRFGGLDAAETAGSKLVESNIEARKPNMIQRFLGYFLGRTTPQQSMAAAAREVPYILESRAGSIKKLTGEVEKYGKQYQRHLAASREKQAPRLIGREFFKPQPPAPGNPYVPYGLPGGGQAGNSSFPDVQFEPEPFNPLQYKHGSIGSYSGPYDVPSEADLRQLLSQENYAGGAGSVKPPVEQPHQPYGQNLPYKPKLKDLVKKKKKG